MGWLTNINGWQLASCQFKKTAYLLKAGADPRGQRGHMPQSPKLFFANIILHRRVLVYKFTDITVMFLSRDSLYYAYRYILSPPNATTKRYLLSERRWPRMSWRRASFCKSIVTIHSRTGCHCGPFRWLWSPQTAFCILKQKWLETQELSDRQLTDRA